MNKDEYVVESEDSTTVLQMLTTYGRSLITQTLPSTTESPQLTMIWLTVSITIELGMIICTPEVEASQHCTRRVLLLRACSTVHEVEAA